MALALIFSALVPAVALAEKPTKTEFTAIVIPGTVVVTEEIDLGKSGRVKAEEYIGGFIPDSTWPLLAWATVDIYARTNYRLLPTGEREGIMLGRMVITRVAGADRGTLELAYSCKISGLGGFTFDGRWNVVEATGVFEGINARGTFFSDPAQGVPPTLSGVYWSTGE